MKRDSSPFPRNKNKKMIKRKCLRSYEDLDDRNICYINISTLDKESFQKKFMLQSYK